MRRLCAALLVILVAWVAMPQAMGAVVAPKKLGSNYGCDRTAQLLLGSHVQPDPPTVADLSGSRLSIKTSDDPRPRAAIGFAAEGGGRLLWTWWQNYPKVVQGGREYAQIGDRLYARHAVDRMQPSGLGAPAGATGAGRSISPNFVEDVLSSTRGVAVKGPNGEARLSFTSGTVQVVTCLAQTCTTAAVTSRTLQTLNASSTPITRATP